MKGDPDARFRKPCLWLAIVGASVLAAQSAAHAQTLLDNLWGVYSAKTRGGLVLYGVVRPVEISHTQDLSGSTLLQLSVTSFVPRRTSGDQARASGTACHYFSMPRSAFSNDQPGSEVYESDFLHYPPGHVSYIDIDGKEYALSEIRIRAASGTVRLEHATLQRTGFLPPIFKRRIHLSFDARLSCDTLSDDIAAKALADVTESERRAQAAYERALRSYRERQAE